MSGLSGPAALRVALALAGTIFPTPYLYSPSERQDRPSTRVHDRVCFYSSSGILLPQVSLKQQSNAKTYAIDDTQPKTNTHRVHLSLKSFVLSKIVLRVTF